jgi:Uma2 family endonuclease
MSFDEYLRFNDNYPRPVEYVAGVAYPRYGRSVRHNRIGMNIGLPLHSRTAETGCHVFMSLMRVHVADDTICYPDIVVTCDPTDNDEWTLFKPSLIVEIVSPETAEIDHGSKREAYLRMPSLLAYLLVSEGEQLIERHWRDNATDDWRTQLISGGIVPLPCPDVELTVEDIYRKLPPVEDE